MKGMSYQRGVIFVGNRYLSGAEFQENISTSWAEPITVKAMLNVSLRVYKAMPAWFQILFVLTFFLSLIPWWAGWYHPIEWYGIPFYLWFYFFLGTHFWFPKEMKKYHGAEHKVFSSNELISVRNIKKIKGAPITNRNCSTNVIVMYFLQLPIILILMVSLTTAPVFHQLEWATYISLLMLPFTVKWLNRGKWGQSMRNWIVSLSYVTQRYVTTLEPDDQHLKVAVKAYRRVLLKEAPGRLKRQKTGNGQGKEIKKEAFNMAIADITITPLGSGSTSVSEVVAGVHQLLKDTDLPIQYELTPMSTIIEGKPEDLYLIIQKIHEVPFQMGHQRIALNVRMDDRRDKESGMALKLKSVEDRLSEEK